VSSGGFAFVWPARVYWEDTDAGGVVYHASYLRFLERARTEWLRAMGVHQQQMRDDFDRVLVVRSMQIDFHKPARLDDQLAVSVGLIECRRASLVMTQAIHNGDTLLLQARVRAACVAASDFRPRPLPEAVCSALISTESVE